MSGVEVSEEQELLQGVMPVERASARHVGELILNVAEGHCVASTGLKCGAFRQKPCWSSWEAVTGSTGGAGGLLCSAVRVFWSAVQDVERGCESCGMEAERETVSLQVWELTKVRLRKGKSHRDGLKPAHTVQNKYINKKARELA